MDDRAVEALVTAAAWLGAAALVRFLLHRAYHRFERGAALGARWEAARHRTTFNLVVRLIVAAFALIGAWSVLSVFPQTDEVARAMLASSAVLALFAGLAFSTPLSNLGAGLLVAFTQPLRLGDRVTIGEHSGFVEEMSLVYTTLVTDEERRVFVPNNQLTAGPIVNRTIRDPRRTITASFPVRIEADIDSACELLGSALDCIAGTLGETRVLVGDPAPGIAWLEALVHAPLDANVRQLASDVRAAGLRTLGVAGLLAPSA